VANHEVVSIGDGWVGVNTANVRRPFIRSVPQEKKPGKGYSGWLNPMWLIGLVSFVNGPLDVVHCGVVKFFYIDL
jgi:hypothetical protein